MVKYRLVSLAPFGVRGNNLKHVQQMAPKQDTAESSPSDCQPQTSRSEKTSSHPNFDWLFALNEPSLIGDLVRHEQRLREFDGTE